MGNIADYFNLPVSSMSNTFTFLNAGIFNSIFLQRPADGNRPVENAVTFWLSPDGAGGCRFDVQPQPGAVPGGDVHSRVVSGITMSIGTFPVTQMYEGRQRGSRLLFTDSFFSMAG